MSDVYDFVVVGAAMTREFSVSELAQISPIFLGVRACKLIRHQI